MSGPRKTKIILAVLVTCVLTIAAVSFVGLHWDKSVQYQFVALKKGTIESTITSTGTLCPVTQVQVGTQVSGTINKVLVDFNDKVRKGEIIAILDSSLLCVAVHEAESGLLRAEAQWEEAKLSYDRTLQLFEKGLVSQADFQPVKTSLKTAQAAMTSAQAALDRAEQNLKYAIIRSPMDGTVTERSVEAGQTVAASFATPTLFTIAQDLSKMEIKALVDESDIGLIKQGRAVRFVVQAYPEKKFEGTVKQVRVQPTTNANVVNYTVIIFADNKENLLLPGMTATVDFIVERKNDVLLVPNTALRFQPSEEVLPTIRRERPQPQGAPPEPLMKEMPAMFPAFGGESSSGFGSWKQLWYQNANGDIVMEPILTGITDGTNTEIVLSRSLSEGMKVINGSSESTKRSAAKSSARTPGSPPRGMPAPPL